MRSLFKGPLVAFVLLIVCLVLLPGSAAAAPVPSIKINSPLDGQVIESYFVSLDFTLKNFKLKDFHQLLKNNPNEGHLLLWLDKDGANTGEAIRYYKESPFTFADVLPGKHTLVVELVNNDQTPFDPQIVQTIKFETRVPKGSEQAPLNPEDAPKVASSKNGETPIIGATGSAANPMVYLALAVVTSLLGILGIFILKRKPNLPEDHL